MKEQHHDMEGLEKENIYKNNPHLSIPLPVKCDYLAADRLFDWKTENWESSKKITQADQGARVMRMI